MKNILEKIKEAKNIILFSHSGPDGDTLGSMMGMKLVIKELYPEKKIETVIQNKIPEIYKFIPEINKSIVSGKNVPLSSYDLAIAIDCATSDRLGDAEEIFKNSKFKINVDHHVTNLGFADINLIDSTASATGEIIYEIAKTAGVMTKDIATCLYVAIITDTGGFRFDNTTSKSLEIASKLISEDISPRDIARKCFEEKPLALIRINAHAVEIAEFCDKNKIAYSIIDRKTMSKFNALDEHLEGISEILKQINTVEVAFCVKETIKGDSKISLRSQSIDVGQIAKFFGGGGHKLAAGCLIQKPPREALNDILPIIRKQIKNDCKIC